MSPSGNGTRLWLSHSVVRIHPPQLDSWKDNRRFRCKVVRSIDSDMVVSRYNNNHQLYWRGEVVISPDCHSGARGFKSRRQCLCLINIRVLHHKDAVLFFSLRRRKRRMISVQSRVDLVVVDWTARDLIVSYLVLTIMERLPWGWWPEQFYFLRLTDRARGYGLRNAGSIPVGSVISS